MNKENIQFTEVSEETGYGVTFPIKAKIEEQQTPFQKIAMYETTKFGYLMTIDGLVMLTSKDNFLYHEMMTHPALLTHPNPENVVIIGGGDCGSLKEVLKHQEVKTAVQVDIDELVTIYSRKYFPELCTSNNDPRATLLFDDGIKWMQDAKESSVDIIIVDSTDPIGPAEGLFNLSFYKNCMKALKPGGILVQQSESPLLHLELIKEMRSEMHKAGFIKATTLQFPQPCYPSGWWSATMATKDADLSKFRSKILDTKYYNNDMHKAAISQPQMFKNAFSQQ